MTKYKVSTILYPSILAAALVAGIFIGLYIGRANTSSAPGNAAPNMKNKLTYTLSLIDQLYVDPVNMDSIAEHLMPLLVGELDPHSVYIPASDMAQANEALDGEFDGIGVVFNMLTDTVVVMNVIPSGPSDKVGVLAGDRIIRINDTLVAGQKINQNDIVKKLRGKRGTTVNLSLQRAGIKDLVPVTVTRGVIPIKSIDAAVMLTPEVAYMKLTQFSRTSHSEMLEALSRLKQEGMTRLIFDLRGNSGGFLDQAILLANEFLPDGDLIVYTLDRRKARTEQFSKGGKYSDLPLVILIDEGSASSSEILAGAIQDNDRGTIIGRRSFGKGLVQQQIPFPDHSAIRLTIARYYTPTGRSIQKPYVNGDMEDYESDLLHRFENNEFFSVDSIKFADSLKFQTPGGRTVYGGGGIMPDLFVPVDTTDVTHYYTQVAGRNILYKYTLEYCDKHRAQINAVKTIDQVRSLLDKDTRLYADFVAYAAARGVVASGGQAERSRALITAQLRALIARNTSLEDNGFYYMLCPIEEPIKQAVKTLSE